MLHQLLHTWLGWVENWGYLGVIILMAMESSIFPVPSEVVIPPAAILAASSGKMSLAGVILAGTFGSWLGSAITYFVSRAVGRPVVERWGKYFFIPPDKLARAERFMHRYEAGGIFFARLLPVLRHLISIPAGIIRMGFGKFSALTIVGAGIWCTVLAWLGGRVGDKLRAEGQDPLDPEALVHAVKHESHLVIAIVLLICVLYFIGMKLSAHKNVGPIITCDGCGTSYTLGVDAVSMTSSELAAMMPGLIGSIPDGLMIGRAETADREQLRRDRDTILCLGPRGWICKECHKDNKWKPVYPS